MNQQEARKARILVVDDEQISAVTLSAILRETGYETQTAFSGEEAVEVAKAFSPDLLLSDIWMNSMSGIEAATRIAAKLPNLKIMFLSGDATMLDVLQASPERIVYSFMLKPARVPDLLNAIAYMLPEAMATAAAAPTEAGTHPLLNAARLENPHQSEERPNSEAAANLSKITLEPPLEKQVTPKRRMRDVAGL